ncbi:hypothetical protein Ae201684P_004683 [Aphanomyces euteiches]|uniref:HPP transmembrane region domain-containing protein n=1 Tax=Aphanomyces euteiches TaxID=100861 RepID=A0A6G0XDH0_9STRA|nr:hypothetical protein Ae201684_006087 [Aphanomyces euteiches]KAH9068986.1 hypothetical protein Ae201684P_004683 [Aphanomyces euteiches]KAH9141546.1 hypothetical protein AeRB84_014275 [Aphanomyces euteiches]
MMDYIYKFRGQQVPPEACPAIRQIAVQQADRARSGDSSRALQVLFWSWLGSFCGIAILAAIQFNLHAIQPSQVEIQTLSASFGAMAILVFGAVQAPLSQPRNAILGSTMSAAVGVGVARLFVHLGVEWKWLRCALAVSLSMLAMQVTDTLHPPGGAAALVAVMGGSELEQLGFLYLITPVLIGTCILLMVSLVLNNVQRQYPRYWIFPPTTLPSN